ncbi:related to BCAS2 family protein [Cephalotrichum gorgonifer]|uniref:Related to BCAS2 family protein n=1 Tax=Cephalotrichum gorgonifer TaxID=2041049 RepID=A0AAE8SRL1_9PEZI|nr:related to BCAS2 family protein [Cephalotrichum gorgonifer]
MSIRHEIFESLPYIDPEPTEPESLAAQSLIAAALPAEQPPHPSLPASTAPAFSPAISALISSTSKLDAIDTARYKPQSASLPADSSLDEATDALARAYTSSSHLATRDLNLSLLADHGKNAWLTGNFHLENILAQLERELAARRAEVDRLALERRRAQDAVAGEMRGLEEAWRTGVGSVLETEVAVESLKAQIREKLKEAQGRA